MKYLGIDYGTKRIGVAISDEDGKLAFPKTVIENNPESVFFVANLAKEENINAIIIGESLDLSGNDNPLMKEINSFKENLSQKTSLPIVFEPEFFTSAEAERLQGKNGKLDSSAAAIILKSFLDKKNNNG
jgi:putative Holliday junction resolvase